VTVDGEWAAIVVPTDRSHSNWTDWTATGLDAVTVRDVLPVGYRIVDRRQSERRQGDRRSRLDRRSP
jgi:hypothetical protein